MQQMALFGYLVLAAGAFAFWLTAFGPGWVRSKNPPAGLVIGVMTLFAGHVMIVDHASLDAEDHSQAITIVAMAVPALFLRIAMRRALRTARLAAAHPVRPVEHDRPAEPAEPPPVAAQGVTLADHLSARMGIAYTDAAGHRSERVIVVHRVVGTVAPDGARTPTMLHAFCEQARQSRSFRVDRIAHAFDPDTGEVVDPIARISDACRLA